MYHSSLRMREQESSVELAERDGNGAVSDAGKHSGTILPHAQQSA